MKIPKRRHSGQPTRKFLAMKVPKKNTGVLSKHPFDGRSLDRVVERKIRQRRPRRLVENADEPLQWNIGLEEEDGLVSTKGQVSSWPWSLKISYYHSAISATGGLFHESRSFKYH